MAKYADLIEVIHEATSGSGTVGDLTSLMASLEGKDHVVVKGFDIARYTLGIVISVMEAIDALGKMPELAGGTFNARLLSASASIAKTMFLMYEDANNIEQQGSFSDETTLQLCETLTDLADFITSVPHIKNHPAALGVNAAANILGMMIAIYGSKQKKEFAETCTKLDELMSKHELTLDGEVSKILNTKNTDKYVGSNWVMAEPVFSFLLGVVSSRVELPENFYLENPGNATQKEIDAAAAREKEIKDSEAGQMVYAAQRFLSIINGNGFDPNYFFGGEEASSEVFTMVNRLRTLFGLKKIDLAEVPKENAADFYAKELKEVSDTINSGGTTLKLVPLIKFSGVDGDNIREELKKDNALAYRYALLMGNPFVMIGIEYAEVHKELDIHNALTEEYIDMRLAFLNEYTSYNLADSAWGFTARASYDYISDLTLGIDFSPEYMPTAGSTPFPYIPHNSKTIIFATADHDLHLDVSSKRYGYVFAGDGDDVITFGGAGEDYIEGGRGKDIYKVSGAGTHRSYDTEGDDRYEADIGGKYTITDLKGNDVYELKMGGIIALVSGNYGEVEVIDREGNDIYKINGANGASKAKVSEHEGDDTYEIKGKGTVQTIDLKGDDTYGIFDNGVVAIDDVEGVDIYQLNMSKGGKVHISDHGRDEKVDQYHINGSGSYYIYDADGKGSITMNGVAFTNGFDLAADGSYITADRNWRLQKVQAQDGSITYLLQQSYSGGYQTKVTFYGWLNTQKTYLGITLNDPTPSASFIDLAPWSENLPSDYFGAGGVRSVRSDSNNNINVIGAWSMPSNGPVAVQFGDSGSRVDATYFGDLIQVGNGSNYINAYLGNDFIKTGSGNDWIIAGSKLPSTLYSDKDYVIAGEGSDYIYGGDDNDVILSDFDNDINGYNQDARGDFVSASHGNDTVLGSQARDILLGGAGEDTIYGGGGDDIILGDADYRMKYTALTSLDHRINDIRWNDSKGYFETTYRTGVDLIVYTSFHWEWSVGVDGIPVIKNVSGFYNETWLADAGGNDILYGGLGNDWIAGQTGDDEIYGGDGDDTIYGDDIKLMPEELEGNDTIYGGRGADKIYGGGGNDILYAGELGETSNIADNDTAQDYLYGGKGDDRLQANGGGDQLHGEEGNDTLYAANDALLYGEEGNDTFHMRDSTNSIAYGGAGDDIFYGNTSNSAKFYGGEGNDVFFAEGANFATFEGGGGDDTFIAGTGNGVKLIGGVGEDTYQFTLDAFETGGTTTIDDSDGKWLLKLDSLQISAASLVGNRKKKELSTWDGRFTIRLEGGNVVITSNDPAASGRVVITNGSNHASFNDLWNNALEPEPVVIAAPELYINKGDTLTADMSAYFFDPVHGDLAYSLTDSSGNAISGLTINEKTGVISGTLDSSLNGLVEVVVTATHQSGKSASQTVTINIDGEEGDPNNQAPVVSGGLSAQQGKQGELFTLVLPTSLFTDPDGDVLAYSVTLANGSALPSWLTYNAATRTLSGTPANGDVGALSLKVIATDPKGLSAEQGFGLTIKNVNDAPEAVGSLPNQQGKEGELFTYIIPESAFHDVDAGDTLTYSVTLANGSALPSWLTYNVATRTLSGTPANGDVGNLNLKITVTDAGGLSAKQDFALNVENVNDAPEVAGTIASQQGKQGELFALVLPTSLFTDPDGDALTYSVTLADGSALPSWLTFNAATRTLSGTPANGDAGTLNFKVTATDPKGLSASQDFALNVENVNDAPEAVGSISDMSLTEGDTFNWTLPAGLFKDIDKGDVLTYSVTLANGSSLPSWLTFDPLTGKLSGVPAMGDHGNLSLKVTATDLLGESASINFGVTVNELVAVNKPPVVAQQQAALTIDEKQNWSYQLSANLFSDPDGDTLSYRVVLADGSALPSWLSYDAVTRTLSGTAGNDDVGGLSLKVIATDSKGLSAEQGFGLTIKNVNDAPEAVGSLADQQGKEGVLFTYSLPAGLFKDIDKGDVLIYSVTLGNGSALPSWLTFDPLTGKLSGVPSTSGDLSFKVIATDSQGFTASHDLQLTIEAKPTYNQIIGTSGDDNSLRGTDGDEHIMGLAGNDTLEGGAGEDLLEGGSGMDILRGDAGNDKLYGEEGNDYLFGGDGDDLLVGGVGNDYLSGGNGSDVYYFEKGWGSDNIDNYASTTSSQADNDRDVVRFGEGISAAEIEVSRIGDRLVLEHKGTGDRIEDKYYFEGEGFKNWTIHEIQFADGTVWGIEDVKAMALLTTDGADTIQGYSTNEEIHGGLGNDTISGHGGDDVLYGEEGDDKLYGGEGNDKLYGGVGNDTLEGGAGEDLLEGGSGMDILRGDAGNDKLYGEEGNDYLFGGDGDDLLVGGVGNDYLSGGNGSDVYYFEKGWGSDNIDNYASTTSSQADNDRDVVRFGEGISAAEIEVSRIGDRLVLEHKGTGDRIEDKYYFEGEGFKNWTIHEIQFADGTVWGIEDVKAMALLTTDGADTIQGYSTNEEIHGGLGNDTISGHGGDDVLYGEEGDDKLYGGEGNDKLYGGVGNDTLEGGAGEDLLEGGSGMDILRGDAGNDKLYGEEGNDYLFGGDGDDLLVGGVGNDYLSGGNGSDVYYFEKGWGSDNIDNYASTTSSQADNDRDVVRFGEGISAAEIEVSRIGDRLVLEHKGTGDRIEDKYYFEGEGFKNWTIHEIQFADGTVWGIEDVKAMALLTTDGADTIQGYSTNEEIHGGLGNDTISGHGGDDVLYGEEGDDKLYGGEGNDKLYGGVGNDTLEGGAGEDLLEGGSGMDILRGDAGNDKLYGEEGNDYLFGGDGDDLLVGGVGNDYLSGGNGSDVYYFEKGWGSDNIDNYASTTSSQADNDRDVVRFGEGISAAEIEVSRIGDRLVLEHKGTGDRIEDKYYFEGEGFKNWTIHEIQFADGTVWGIEDVKAMALLTTDGADTIQGYSTNEEIHGGLGNDTISGHGGDDVLYGEEGDDKLYGGEGNDKLYGGVGNDTLEGGAGEDLLEGGSGMDILRGDAGNDKLYGEEGNDYLFGGDGDDLLVGGVGNDYLSGGNGSDVYYFEKGWGSDNIDNYASTTSSQADNDRDVVRFGEGISAAEIEVSRIGDRLVLEHKGTGDRIEDKYYFEGEGFKNWTIHEIQFADGTVWGIEDVKAMANPTRMFSANAFSTEPMAAMQIDSLVSAMASFAPIAAGTSSLVPEQQVVVPLLAVNY